MGTSNADQKKAKIEQCKRNLEQLQSSKKALQDDWKRTLHPTADQRRYYKSRLDTLNKGIEQAKKALAEARKL